MNFRKSVPISIDKIFGESFIPININNLEEAYQSLEPILVEVEKIDEIMFSIQANELKMKKVASHKEVLYTLIKDMWTKPEGWDFVDNYSDYLSALDENIEQLPEFHKEPQAEDRFKPLANDKWHLKWRKLFKYRLYLISILPKKTYNAILKVFKRAPIKVDYWQHKIPLQRIVKKVYQTELVNSLIEVEKSKYFAFIKVVHEIKNYENQADLILTDTEGELVLTKLSDQGKSDFVIRIREQIEANKLNNVQAIQGAFSSQNDRFINNMDKADTIEMPSRYFNPRRTDKKFERINKTWLANTEGWSRTLYVLFDDWRLDFEINFIKTFAYNSLFNAIEQLSKVRVKHLNSLVRITEVLQAAETKIGKKPVINNDEATELKNDIQAALRDRIIPEVIAEFDDKQLLGIAQSIESELKEQIDSLSDNRALIKVENYSKLLKEQDVNYIIPNELISFEAFQGFSKDVLKLRNTTFNQLENITSLIPDIDNIVLFSIETSFNNANQDDEVVDESTQIILDAIGRANNRLAEVESHINELESSYSKNLTLAIRKFTNDAVSLTQSDNALSIRIRLIKARALQQTKNYKENFTGQITKILRVGHKKFFGLFTEGQAYVKRISKKYFLQPADASVTQEISKFLSESESSINELPTIYRRLYKVEPVTDLGLFIGREQEFLQVKGAYDNWQNGWTASTVIVGEKWSGISSLVNKITDKVGFAQAVIRVEVSEKLYEEHKLIHFLAQSLSLKNVDSRDDLIKAIKRQPQKKIFILENIQHLYLRSFNGFDALRSLAEIIYQTQKEIFWLLTSSLHAWDFLKKTILLNDYVQHVVSLKAMSIDEINSLLLKRNQIGGFKIVFDPPEEYKNYKKFTGATEDEQQELLQKRFYKRLNSFSETNIGMALIFWLLSTKSVTDDLILIGDFDNPDRSFVQLMSETKIFILLALILHDGLSLPELILVNNQAPTDFRLQVAALEEDGIIINQSGYFKVNSLIYQHVVMVLNAKNLIN